jgi:hypothetical protein
MAPTDWVHWVVQSLASWLLQVAKLLSWHCAWQLTFAWPVHEPVQSALHLVVQSSVVGMETHVVVQWSSQHAPHDASQSVVEEDEEEHAEPSDSEEDEEVELQDALHPELQRELQSVVQSIDGGLAVHLVEQSDSQDEVQLASAVALHCALHDCSSFAAHASSQLAGAHCVEQLLFNTSEQFALAVMSIFPQAEMAAFAGCGSAVSAANARAVDALRTQRVEEVFISGRLCNRRTSREWARTTFESATTPCNAACG